MITTAPNTQAGVIKPLQREGCLPLSIRLPPREETPCAFLGFAPCTFRRHFLSSNSSPSCGTDFHFRGSRSLPASGGQVGRPPPWPSAGQHPERTASPLALGSSWSCICLAWTQGSQSQEAKSGPLSSLGVDPRSEEPPTSTALLPPLLGVSPFEA